MSRLRVLIVLTAVLVLAMAPIQVWAIKPESPLLKGAYRIDANGWHYVHPSGFVTCEGLIHFDGNVATLEGKLVILFVGKRAVGGPWSGQWVILSGTDDLANLNGQGTWWGPPFDLDYSGQIHFDPA